VIVYFGYLYPEKGVETVLDAAGLARASVPALRLLMIGGTPANLADRDPTYLQRLLARARECGLAERTHWAGHCDGATALAHLRAADACVLPFTQGVRLHHSSFAVAASAGLPVITTRGPHLEPEFRDRENVLLFAPGDAAAAAAAITELALMPSLRDTLRGGALEFARGRSSWQAVVRETVRILSPNPEHTTCDERPDARLPRP
jgi:glycosyltransferase involved in cell wall biosynthesis